MNVPMPHLRVSLLCVSLVAALLGSCADDADTVMGTNRASGYDAGETSGSDAAAQPDAQPIPRADTSAPELDAQVDANKSISVVMDARPPLLDATPSVRMSSADGASEAEDASSAADAALPSEELAGALLGKLRTCGIVGVGEHQTRPVLDAFDRCRTQCELEASCAVLMSTRCGGQRDAVLETCLTACTTTPRDDGFACGTRRIRKSWVCDGVQHCAGREDESSCTPTACADGTQVSKPTPLCDGVKDCGDGSDELSCAPYCM